jgi:predicted RNase H-like nuclease
VIAVGADATPRGWLCVATAEGGLEAAVLPPDPAAILDRWPAAEVVAIDIPVGLGGEPRRADLSAREFVGARWASVWLTPSRAVLASEWSPELHVSLQAHGMRRRIFAVEALADRRFHEVHPEVTFAHLSRRRPLAPKRTWAGLLQRLELLEAAGFRPPPALAPADDVLDAAAAAWTGARIARGEASTLPSDPAPGEPVIWY